MPRCFGVNPHDHEPSDAIGRSTRRVSPPPIRLRRGTKPVGKRASQSGSSPSATSKPRVGILARSTVCIFHPRCSLSQFTKVRSEEHTSELQSHSDLVCRLLLEKTKY